MSDIDHLVKALDPAPHAPEQGPGARELRAAIMATQDAPRRTVRRRLPWPAGAVGLVAAATATAVFLSQAPPEAGTTTSLSGRSILLAAAAKAVAAPQGTYWHSKEQSTWSFRPYGKNATYDLEISNISERWVARDGRRWTGRKSLGVRPLDEAAWRKDGSPTRWLMGKDGGFYTIAPGKAELLKVIGKPKLDWGDKPITLEEVEALPADPEKLKERAAAALRVGLDIDGSVDTWVPRTLASLLWDIPTSPQVRGAAFEALATLPQVQVEGRTTDVKGRPGVAVTFPLVEGQPARGKLIIDPDTSKVLSYEQINLPEPRASVTVVLETGWTDAEPAPPTTE
ncbi:CU044_5270 family protein [Nonomuraea sp. NBC_01738]|uniref:CU044_5270 family protein n=1 Tax=Nonomuraea sp. NBC_01738 TaxID=2976003 RepID=UPI002E15FC52|nr:CU044_5270 family protein [Nonomuraea sp. NBC_01738]